MDRSGFQIGDLVEVPKYGVGWPEADMPSVPPGIYEVRGGTKGGDYLLVCSVMPEANGTYRKSLVATRLVQRSIVHRCPECDGPVDERVRAGMKCASCAYGGGQ